MCLLFSENIYSRTLVLELNLFQKTVQEAVCSKIESPLFVAWETHDWLHRHQHKGVVGTELSPNVLLDV